MQPTDRANTAGRSRPPAAIAAGAAAGLVGGLVASWLMVKFQQKVWPPPRGDGGSSTANLARDVARLGGGGPLTYSKAKADGMLIHYTLGGALGLAYGAAAAVEPRVGLGRGIVFGVATELAIDQIAVPALGLANPFWKCPVEWHLRGLAAHVVFGAATDATWRLLIKAVDPHVRL